jgi:hypothetical protein
VQERVEDPPSRRIQMHERADVDQPRRERDLDARAGGRHGSHLGIRHALIVLPLLPA